MAFYETTFIARQDISQADAAKLAESFATIITERGGEIVKTEYWGLLNLAYLIKKNKKGHYFMFGINADYSVVKELERKMKLNENVIRQMTINVEELTKEPSVMMRADEN